MLANDWSTSLSVLNDIYVSGVWDRKDRFDRASGCGAVRSPSNMVANVRQILTVRSWDTQRGRDETSTGHMSMLAPTRTRHETGRLTGV